MAELEPLQTIANRTFKMIAEHSFPTGTEAYCPKCNARRHAATSEIAQWMASGFPECRCGGKVTIETPRERKP